jgi:deoxyadenosine/deoxycytidine kinase
MDGKQVHIITIDGSIACGKTTLVNNLKEDVDAVFIEDFESACPTLREYYAATTKEECIIWWHAFQLTVLSLYMERSRRLYTLVKESDKKNLIIVLDRSYLSPIPFYDYAVDEKIINPYEWDAYKRITKAVYDRTMLLVPAKWHNIRIEAEPEECLIRAIERNEKTNLITNNKDFLKPEKNVFTPENFMDMENKWVNLQQIYRLNYSYTDAIIYARVRGSEKDLANQLKEYIQDIVKKFNN